MHRRAKGSAWLAGLATLALSAAAGAAPMETLVTPFTGDATSVRIVLSERDGGIEFQVSVAEGLGDLRGVFFDVLDDSLLGGLGAFGEFVTDFRTGSVINMGNGNNLNGGGSPCPCDVGVALGTPGMGKDDIQSTSFLLKHTTHTLTLSLLFGENVGVRVTSVGDATGREGSSKLRGAIPVPEPTTVALLALGCAGLAGRRRARR